MSEIGSLILAGLQFDPSFFEKYKLIPEYFLEGRDRAGAWNFLFGYRQLEDAKRGRAYLARKLKRTT